MIAVSEQFRSISRVMIAYNGTMEPAKAIKRIVQMRLSTSADNSACASNRETGPCYEP